MPPDVQRFSDVLCRKADSGICKGDRSDVAAGSRSRLRLLLGICAGLLACLPGAGMAASFDGLGSLGGGGDNAEAAGVSGDGKVVVGGCTFGSSCDEAWRWTTSTGMVGLGFLPGDVVSRAFGASFDGSVVAGFSEDASLLQRATRWVDPTGWEDLSGDLSALDVLSQAFALSSDGSKAVGGYYRLFLAPTDTAGFLWEDGVGATLYLQTGLSLHASEMRDISDTGVMCGNENTNFLEPDATGYRVTEAGGLTSIPPLPSRSFSNTSAISADGTTIVGVSDVRAYRWRSGSGTIGLGTLFPAAPSPYSRATDVSQDGNVVVGWSSSDSTENAPWPPEPDLAFIWTSQGGIQNLKTFLTDLGFVLDGWTLTEATGISHDGNVIVGNGINPLGDREPWRADFTGLIAIPEVPAFSKPFGRHLAALLLFSVGIRVLRRRAAGEPASRR